MTGRVFFLADDTTAFGALHQELERQGFRTTVATSFEDGRALQSEPDTDAVVVGRSVAERLGWNLRHAIDASAMGASLIVVEHEQADLQHAVTALRAGADDYVADPRDPRLLVQSVSRAVATRRLALNLSAVERAKKGQEPFSELIGDSAVMERLRARLPRIAASDASVLIIGESGTGKDIVARALHQYGPRGSGAFVAVDCGAVPEHLMESEFFGHARGAFTDASDAHAGLLVRAHGGTLFLDEVGSMPLSMQAKLLRALQQRSVRPLGQSSEVAFDARIIAASSVDLSKEVARGRFREDLLFRLDVVQVSLAPLRDREHDVLRLAQHFIEEAAAATGREIVGLTPAAGRCLLSHHWPGNVRELENCIHAAVALARYDHITEDDLPPPVRKRARESDVDAMRSLDTVEGEHIAAVLHAVNGNKARASRLLGLDRKTLYRKLRRYGLYGSE